MIIDTRNKPSQTLIVAMGYRDVVGNLLDMGYRRKQVWNPIVHIWTKL